jgi:hypothetical protein
LLGANIDLDDVRAFFFRVKLAIRKIRTEHQQHVAIEHRIVTRRKANQTCHADVIRIVPLDVFLAAHRMHHR